MKAHHYYPRPASEFPPGVGKPRAQPSISQQDAKINEPRVTWAGVTGAAVAGARAATPRRTCARDPAVRRHRAHPSASQ